MRVEPFSEGSFVHVIKRGARGMDIVLDQEDKELFVKSLFILNDNYSNENWRRETVELPLFTRPKHWPERDRLTDILLWTLMPNHFHILLREKKEGGVSKFMQRLCGSMSMNFNKKYNSKGSVFQGSYKGKVVDNDSYLRYLAFYIHIKNVLELYPGGLKKAVANFDDAWNWAIKYPFSGFSAYSIGAGSPIISDVDGLMTNIHNKNVYKQEAYEMLLVYVNKQEDTLPDRLRELILE
ncbi:MAG: transposase [Parcubacteria group bacterium]